MAKHQTWNEDALGYSGDSVLKTFPVGSTWFHQKTGRLYNVVGLGFDSERERWGVRYVPTSEDTGFPYFHLPEDFGREGRFLRVKE